MTTLTIEERIAAVDLERERLQAEADAVAADAEVRQHRADGQRHGGHAAELRSLAGTLEFTPGRVSEWAALMHAVIDCAEREGIAEWRRLDALAKLERG